ncbi:MAG: hypothetical protein NC548_32365 [Lachnospiraceae bacterium]|nr:hypothetical protein [Lachnospiraceae bacterium]
MANLTSTADILRKVLPSSVKQYVDINAIAGEQEKPATLAELLGFDFFPEQKAWADWAMGSFKERKRKKNGRLKEPGEVKMIIGARGYGKTESIIFYGCTQMLKKNPNLTFVVSTRKQTRAKEMITLLSHIMPRMGFRGRFLFESIRLERPDGTYSKQPTFKIIPVGTPLKGNHCNVMIVDDPLDPSDYRSATWKERALKFTQDCQDIADLTIIIGQYINEDDLYVHYENTLRPENILRCWHGTLPQLDVQWEEKRAQGYTLRQWGLNYEGKFYPDDERRLKVELTEQMPFGTYCFIDLSFVRKSMRSPDGDFTAVAFGQFAGPPRQVAHGKTAWQELIVAGYLFPNAEEMQKRIIGLIEKHQCEYVIYDATMDRFNEFFGFLNVESYQRILLPKHVKPLPHEHEKKHNKIIRNICWLQNTGSIKYWHKSDKMFLDQVEMYTPEAEHDDAPDAVASLIRDLRLGYKTRRDLLMTRIAFDDTPSI